jgi:DNA-binding PadR family transcriptional regulator
MQLVEKISEGAVSMGPGTLYSTLQRLLSLRLVEETTRYKRPDELERRRRFYRLTPLGRKLFDLEISRMKSVVRRAAATRLKPIEQDEE